MLEVKDDRWFGRLDDDSPKVKWMRRVYLLRKASEARVNRRLRRYYLIVRLLPNVFALACLPLSSI